MSFTDLQLLSSQNAKKQNKDKNLIIFIILEESGRGARQLETM